MLRVAEQASAPTPAASATPTRTRTSPAPPIFVVADGMGGAQAGEVASKTAAEAFDRDLPGRRARRRPARDDRSRQPRDPRARPRRPLPRRDGDDAHRGDRRPEGEEVAIGHVGDSRAYRLRDGKLERLTRDHSLVEELRRQGQLTDDQAEEHPQRSIITRALGPEPEVEVDMQTVPARPGDVFLLCTDGLTTMVAEEQIARLLAGADLDGGGGASAGRRGQPRRRPRQHHRARLPARRRRRAGRGPREGATLIGRRPRRRA